LVVNHQVSKLNSPCPVILQVDSQNSLPYICSNLSRR